MDELKIDCFKPFIDTTSNKVKTKLWLETTVNESDLIELQQNSNNALINDSIGTLMNFSVSSLVAGLIFSVIGIWMFRRGRAKSNITVVVISILLMVYPMFTKNPWQDWGIGTALCAYAKYKWDY